MIEIGEHKVYIDTDLVVVKYRGNIQTYPVPKEAQEGYEKIVAASIIMFGIILDEDTDEGLAVSIRNRLCYFIRYNPDLNMLQPEHYREAIKRFIRPAGVAANFFLVTSDEEQNLLEKASDEQRREYVLSKLGR